MADVGVYLLGATAAWDAMTVSCMLLGLDEIHWMLWTDEDEAGRILLLFAVMFWGLVRVLAACFIVDRPWLVWPAVGTYVLESLFLIVCSCAGVMRTWRTVATCVAAWVCCGLILDIYVPDAPWHNG